MTPPIKNKKLNSVKSLTEKSGRDDDGDMLCVLL